MSGFRGDLSPLDLDDEHQLRALSSLGLTDWSTDSCPRRVVDLPHDDVDCWCLTPLNDHGRTWTQRSGLPVVTWEPYDTDGESLVHVLLEAAHDGLRVTATGTSPWNPGHTFALLFAAAGARPARPHEAT